MELMRVFVRLGVVRLCVMDWSVLFILCGRAAVAGAVAVAVAVDG